MSVSHFIDCKFLIINVSALPSQFQFQKVNMYKIPVRIIDIKENNEDQYNFLR